MKQREFMIDLETLDTRSTAVILSIGAVIWDTNVLGDGSLAYEIVDRFYRTPDIDEQLARGRTVSQHTLFWWQWQDPTARAEAFSTTRFPGVDVLADLKEFVAPHVVDHGLNRFWANPTTFDFPITESYAESLGGDVPWNYNQKHDVRTVVTEASYSAKEHDYGHLVGIPHTPVYDCEAQIDLLTAARNRIARRTR